MRLQMAFCLAVNVCRTSKDGSWQSIWCAGQSCLSRSFNQTNQKDQINQIDEMNQLPAERLGKVGWRLTSVSSPLYDFVIQEGPMKHARVPVTVSLPSNLAESFEKLAKAESKNKSQLFREMLTTYKRRRREERFLDLQRYGVKKARKNGVLTEADVEKLVFQGR
jgi:predicted transcriptional regulator